MVQGERIQILQNALLQSWVKAKKKSFPFNNNLKLKKVWELTLKTGKLTKKLI